MSGVSKKVYMVDDDMQLCQLVSRVAQQMNIPFEYTVDSAGAVDFIQNSKPSHIIMDMVMPGQDGIEIILKLSDLDYEPLFLLVSGYGDIYTSAAEEFAHLKGFGNIQSAPKPFKMSFVRSFLEQNPATM